MGVVLSRYFFCVGFGTPALLVALLLACVGSETEPHGRKRDPNFQYGETQAYVTLCVLVVCFAATVTCMMLAQRFRTNEQMQQQQQQQQQQQGGSRSGRRHRSDEAERHLLEATESEESDPPREPQPNYQAVEEHTGDVERRSPIPIEDLLQLEEGGGDDEGDRQAETTCCEDGSGGQANTREERRRQLLSSSVGTRRRRYRCNTEHREYCSSLLNSYAVPPAREASDDHVSLLAGDCPKEEEEDSLQLVSHVVLLLLLATSMFVGEEECISSREIIGSETCKSSKTLFCRLQALLCACGRW